MRLIAALVLLLLAAPAAAQPFSFTPPGESQSISNYGVHLDVLQAFPGDRWSLFAYGENGAYVANLESLTVPIIYGLVDAALGGDALDPDAGEPSDRTGEPDRTASNARSAPGFIDVWLGKTFIPTPFGEVGVGLDAGFLALQATPRYFDGDQLEFVAQAGPNLLFTSRPIENLHAVVHASYQFTGLSEVIQSGRKVVDIQGYYRLNSWVGLYGGFHWSSWNVEGTSDSGNPSTTFTSKGLTFGVTFIPMWQQF